jgi:hypothetical protein
MIKHSYIVKYGLYKVKLLFWCLVVETSSHVALYVYYNFTSYLTVY